MGDDPEFEWDDEKARRNLARHGVAFETIRSFDWSTCTTFPDVRFDYDEPRLVSHGLVGARLHVAIWTPRQERVRLISLRKANQREIRNYLKGYPDHG